MKTKININGNEVEITLTPDQVREIKKADLKIIDRIKTFEDACQETMISAEVKALLSIYPLDKNMKAVQAYAKIQIIARALNEGWTPDYSNHNEYKYYPWLKFTPGSGFSFDDYAYDCTGSFVGSRLCYKTRELAEYAATQFKDIYNDFLN